MVSDSKNFPNNAFETTEFWYIVRLTAIYKVVLQRKNTTFLICSAEAQKYHQFDVKYF